MQMDRPRYSNVSQSAELLSAMRPNNKEKVKKGQRRLQTHTHNYDTYRLTDAALKRSDRCLKLKQLLQSFSK